MKCPHCNGTGIAASSNADDIAQIVEYMNDVTRGKYRASSRYVKEHINARLGEGYSVDEFKLVIDHMNTLWGSDPVMSRYLRPQTLFGPKFASYLADAERSSNYNKPKVSY